MHRLLYDAIELASLDARVVGRATEVPDLTRFITCAEQDKTTDQVREDISATTEIGVRGTPGIVINGLYLGSTPDSAKLFDLVERALIEPKGRS